MKICTFLQRGSVALVGFAATIMLAGCAGVSTAAPESGSPVPAHSVYLSWNRSASSDVSGYNIYRAVYTQACGSFSKINPELVEEPAYTDSTVANGAFYCYAATAVNEKKEESGFSEIIVGLQIPDE